MAFITQAVSFTLEQLITASSTGSAGSPLANSLTVAKEPRSLSLTAKFDGFGWLSAGKLTDRTKGAPVPEFNGQFDWFGWLTAGKLTDRTAGELRSLSLSKGPFQIVYLYRRSRIWL